MRNKTTKLLVASSALLILPMFAAKADIASTDFVHEAVDYVLSQITSEVDTAVGALNIPGQVGTAIANADIPGQVDTAVGTLNIPGQVGTAITNADIPGQVDTAVGTLNIPGQVTTAITNANIPGLVAAEVAALDIPSLSCAPGQAVIQGATPTTVTCVNIADAFVPR